MLSEIRQTQEGKYHMLSLIYRNHKNANTENSGHQRLGALS